LGFDASALIAGLIEIEIKGTEELAYERICSETALLAIGGRLVKIVKLF
jgi:hypothetical protein